MANRLDTAMAAVRRIIVALFALAQLIPSGVAFASNGEGVALVICTADGSKSVSWEEVTGGPSPFEAPADHDDPDSCPACHTTCRAAAAEPRLEWLSHPAARHEPAAYPQAAAAPILSAPRSPSPPRAPPFSR